MTAPRSTVREQLAIDFLGGTYTGSFYVADVEASGVTGDDEFARGPGGRGLRARLSDAR